MWFEVHGRQVMSVISRIYTYTQGCTNPGQQVENAAKFCATDPSIGGS
jgi:hypothetical protein